MSATRLASTSLRIPKRIDRGPTDILQALSSTLKYIPKEPAPVLQDDPYLLPIRPGDKKFYILSKLNGKKTAKFLLNKHPEFFYRDDAEPKVAAFKPMEEYNSEMEFTEDDIKWCISETDPVNAEIAYKSLEEKGVKISDETLLEFFELLCYTNGEKKIDEIDAERERYVPQSEEDLVNQTWKNSGLATKIFKQMKDNIDPPRVYSAMIAGLSKYNEHTTAKQIFDEFRTAYPDTGLHSSAYNGLLNSIFRINSSVSSAHEAINEIVRHMEDNLVKPDLMAFNSILRTYRSFQCDDETCQKAFQLLNDMKALSIEPSLATFNYLIAIICRYRGGSVYSDMIKDILEYIDSNNLGREVKDERDVLFLVDTMNIFANRMNNLKLAKRLHKIYLKNSNLFSSQRLQIRYLNNYFKLMITTDSLENCLKFYEEYVPTQFLPSVDCYEAFVEILDLYKATDDVIKKVGRDLIEFKVAQKIQNDEIFRKDKTYVDGLETLRK